MAEDMSGFSKQDDFEEEDYYLSPEGFIVFTEKYHCPYGFDKKTGKMSNQ